MIIKFIEELIYIGMVLAGFYLAFLIKFNLNPLDKNINPFFESIPYIIIASIIIFYFYDIVSTLKKTVFENLVIIGLSLILIDIITIAVVFFMRGFAFPRSVFLIGYVLQFGMIMFTKLFVLWMLRRKERKEKILIIADKKEADHIAKKIIQDDFISNNIKISYNDDNDFKIIKYVDKVYLGSSIDNKKKNEIINLCVVNEKIVYLVPTLFEISLVNFKMAQASDMLFFRMDNLELTYEKKIMKRLMDLCLSAFGIILTLPIMIIVAIIIKVYDGGHVFFKQERVTKNNKKFNLYKFRTMIVNAEQKTGPILATEKDERITPLGRFLRASRIDELPQLFNVIKGDMSIVGPRPERPYFVEQFSVDIEEFRYRTAVKAGISGLAQILGRYSTSPQDKAKYDLLYIKNYSLALDIKIIFNTIKIMFIKSSSAGVSEDKQLNDMIEKFKI